ncbi:MAG: bifunctional precorrin-2 dehydrogenase/sirohydrochlorin ferrochelatase [Deltaproteobacteria bacterium]|nr:bifunctional precorrin-2 dehydrogenase/sirohydrochlorin ferrochelatase [Deltaproteobacteria bacterium]
MKYQENYYYPIFVDLRGKRTVVVGGGHVAGRKIEPLLAAGAEVTVIAPEIIEGIASMDNVSLLKRSYQSGDLKGAVLVIAATDDMEINAMVSSDAMSLGIFCNIVDIPDMCSFIVPSVVEKGPIKIAISTGGISPALSRKLRMEIGGLISDEYGTLALIMGKIRPLVLSREGGHENHKRIFDVLVNSELFDAIRAHDRELAERILFEALGEHIDLEEIFPC